MYKVSACDNRALQCLLGCCALGPRSLYSPLPVEYWLVVRYNKRGWGALRVGLINETVFLSAQPLPEETESPASYDAPPLVSSFP